MHNHSKVVQYLIDHGAKQVSRMAMWFDRLMKNCQIKLIPLYLTLVTGICVLVIQLLQCLTTEQSNKLFVIHALVFCCNTRRYILQQ